MPDHLQKLEVSERAKELLIELKLWLTEHGKYEAVADNLEQCVSDREEKKARPLGTEIAKSFIKENPSFGIAKARDGSGQVKLRTGEHATCLMSLRVKDGSSPFVSDGKIPIAFSPGYLLYIAPNSHVFVDEGVEFMFVNGL